MRETNLDLKNKFDNIKIKYDKSKNEAFKTKMAIIKQDTEITK